MSVISLDLVCAPMEILDRVFQVIFARYRRKLGESNLESAWRRATNRVSGYLVLPIAATAGALVLMMYAFTGAGTAAEHKRSVQMITVVAGVVVFYLLDQRFRKYLQTPPALPSVEARADTQLVFWFRVIAVGIFALTCLVGFFLHQAGHLRGM
jgi:hypothetical protein